MKRPIEKKIQTEQRATAVESDEPLNLIDRKVDLDADSLLQASRRLDWRFLLPDPDLGHVACVGSVPDSLLDALQLFSLSVTSLPSFPGQAEQQEQYDLVVVKNLSDENLERAAKLLGTEGYLYAESKGMLPPKLRHLRSKNRRYANPASCVTAVSQKRFTDVQAHWHWPNFGACTKIIPLDDKGALSFSFIKEGHSLKAKIRSGIGRWLLNNGLLAQIVPHFSIVARLDSA